jgi:hypothetical protein
MSKTAASPKRLTVEEVTAWMRAQSDVLRQDRDMDYLAVDKLMRQFVVDHGASDELDAMVAHELERCRRMGRLGGHRHLFVAYRIALGGQVSPELVQQIHGYLVGGACHRQVQQTLKLLGRDSLTVEEIEAMVRAYYGGGSSSTEDDRYFRQLVKSLPGGELKRELKEWVAERIKDRSFPA